MMRRTVIRSRAQAEMDEALNWYADRSAIIAGKFAAALRAGLIAIAEDPLRYAIVHKGVRRFNIAGFPYGLFYRIKSDEIIVLSCFHGRRNPAGWRNRR